MKPPSGRNWCSASTDPFGHLWTIATHVDDVSEEEMERRMATQGQECAEG